MFEWGYTLKEIGAAKKERDAAPAGSQKKLEAEAKLFSLQKERLQYLQERNNALLQDMDKMKESITRYRETAVTGINARSTEAIRLQSRVMLTGSNNYAKMSAENAKRSSDTLDKMATLLDDVKRVADSIKTSVSNITTSSF